MSPPFEAVSGLLGKVHRQRAKVLAAVQPVLQRLDLLLRLGVVRRLAVLQIARLRRGHIGHLDLRQVVLRLYQVELGLVLVVVVRNVCVGYGDLRVDLFIQQLVDRQRVAAESCFRSSTVWLLAFSRS